MATTIDETSEALDNERFQRRLEEEDAALGGVARMERVISNDARRHGLTLRRLLKKAPVHRNVPAAYQVVGSNSEILADAVSLAEARDVVTRRQAWRQLYERVYKVHAARRWLLDKEDVCAVSDAELTAFEEFAHVEAATRVKTEFDDDNEDAHDIWWAGLERALAAAAATKR